MTHERAERRPMPKMSKGIALLCAFVVWAAYVQARSVGPQGNPQNLGVRTQALGAPADQSPDRALLNKYCVGCHNERLKTAGLLLDKASLDRVGDDPMMWEKVARRLETRTMPPAGQSRPDVET